MCPKGKPIFKSLCHNEGISLFAGKGLNPSRKCTHNDKGILTTHTKWQWNEFQSQVSKGYRGRRHEVSGDKKLFQGYGSDRLDIGGKPFCTVIEAFPPMSIYNVSHFKCPVVGEGMKNTKAKKNGVC